MKIYIAILFLCFCCADIQAQLPFHANFDVTVEKEGEILDLAWAGGLDNAQFSEIDFDGDGIMDLFVFDKSGNSILTLRHNGEKYEYAPQYARMFPRLLDWVLLADYDGDGVKDIFTDENGFRVLKGAVDGDSWSFVEAKNRLRYGEDEKIIYISQADIPALTDIEGDGDLDILTFDVGGAYMQWYENLSQDLYGHADSLVFEKSSDCWGNFVELGDGTIQLEACEMGKKGKSVHAGSTILALDIEGDNDKDLILADVIDTSFTFLLNGGNADSSVITAFTQNYLNEDLFDFPAAYLIDFNNDGKKDLLTSPNDEIYYENTNHIGAYKNVSDNGFEFVLEEEGFLIKEMIDVGSDAFPVWVDYNVDGLLDIVIGNKGYFNRDSLRFYSSLTLYENMGTNETPSFRWITNNFANLGQYNYANIYPAFTDLDQDGDMDLLIGSKTEKLHYFENIADSNTPMELELNTFNVVTSPYLGFSTPTFFDINEDGLDDLIVGEKLGRVLYYENTSNGSNISFELISDYWGEVDVRQFSEPVGFPVPTLFEQDGSRYLMVNTLEGNLFLYTDLENEVFTLVDNNYSNIKESGEGGLSITDIDNDGYLDLLVGNARGGIGLYSQNPIYNDIEFVEQTSPKINIYPNPTDHFLHIEIASSNPMTITIYDVLGRLQKTEVITDLNDISVDVSALETGLYFCEIVGDDGRFVERFFRE